MEARHGGFLLWCILFFLCWPIAILALVLYPFVWLITLPFRIVGIAVQACLGLLTAIFMLPVRLLTRALARFELNPQLLERYLGVNFARKSVAM